MVIGLLALAAYPFMSTLDADVAYTEAAEATSKLHEVPFLASAEQYVVQSSSR